MLYQLSYVRVPRILAAWPESPSEADAHSTPTRWHTLGRVLHAGLAMLARLSQGAFVTLAA